MPSSLRGLIKRVEKKIVIKTATDIRIRVKTTEVENNLSRNEIAGLRAYSSSMSAIMA
jgi:flagellum-specific peptidoglycan hydrolase FlgJ